MSIGRRISALPLVASAQITDFIAAVQGGITSRESLQQIFNLFQSLINPIPWNDVSTPTQMMLPNNAYIADSASTVVFNLPAVISQGQIVQVAGNGSGGWSISQNAGQQINLGASSTTPGVTGGLNSTNQYDGIILLCTVANTIFVTPVAPQGNITVV